MSYTVGQKFRAAISGLRLSAIAEFKRRSPSMGDIRPDARIEEIVPAYERGGASAVSILVDERFAGSIDDLRAARAVTTLPLLAKGFFSTEEHLREVREAGADATLLILRDLDDETTSRLISYAGDIGLEALVETHNEKELHRAMRFGDGLTGVNARDLSTFKIDRSEQLRLIAFANGIEDFVVAESGIHTRVAAVEAELAGAHAVLVGTSLMQASDPESKLRDLIARPLVKVCGLTRQEDVDAAVDAGADMLGFIFAEGSPRKAPAVLDVPETALSVAVFVGEREERGADLVQVYEPAKGKVRGRHAFLSSPHGGVLVFDQPWGENDPDRWQKSSPQVFEKALLAGGLGPDNVHAAIDALDPWGVDAASGLESAPGIKDHAKVRAFVEAAHS